MAGIGSEHLRPTDESLLRVEDLEVEFRTPQGRLHAVSGVSLDVLPGETVGIVGESGSGKSTTARAILQLPAPRRGAVHFEGVDLTGLGGERLRRVRTRLQVIFQDPISSLNPRRSIRDIVAEGPRIWESHATEAELVEAVDAMLRIVGLDPEVVGDRRPSELSGGQCQRVAIARALMLDPALIVCDEAVSALDVSVQAQILNLLEDAKARFGLALVFIAHDLAVVKHVSDRVVVMYLGRICEVGPPDALFRRPAHPYTDLLMRSMPTAGENAVETLGELPSPMNPPSGCRFRTRCPAARERCHEEVPAIRQVAEGQFVACHYPITEPITEPSPAADRARERF